MKIFKTMFFVSLVVLIILLIFVATAVVSAVSLENSNTESVAIIGGADGPTAILITSTLIFDHPTFRLLILVAIVFIVSSVGWLVSRKK
ncbi:MAG: sodium ion-translocating decarboxylase subunit beta [Ruminococcaceae bacterium]|nr:sodium ion-translocating decarboxylase subunit beta [Oscillospiraceae bacterium]